MKKLKYLILMLFIIPTVVLAEPIHLTQAAIEECFANEGVYNETYKMTFKLEYAISGFFLYGDEYIIDEDLSLHKAHFGAENNTVVVNLDGHTISSLLDKYSPVPGYLSVAPPVACGADGCDMTFNGPGKIDPSETGFSNAVLNENGKITFNNLEIVGNIKAADYSTNVDLGNEYVLNNVNLSGRFEIWNSKITINGGRFNYLAEYSENQIIGSTAIIKNATLGTLRSNGIYINDDTGSQYSSGKKSDVLIDNCNITGGTAVISYGSTGNLLIENSELWANGTLGAGYYGLSLYTSDPHIQMADVHIHTDRTDWPYPTITGSSSVSMSEEEYFNALVKPGYIYWKDPVFEKQDYEATQYTEAYTSFRLTNTDIWIIKQQEEYEAEEQTYEIPEDNEVIIKVSGYKFLFEKLIINDQEVPDTDYEILDTDGDKDVSIKIKNDYLKTLEANKYDIEVEFTNGSATTTLNVVDAEPISNEVPEVKGEVDNPKTGLTSYTYLLAIALIFGVAAILVGKKSYFKR